jgi:Transglutaminase-like superfamily
VSTDSQHTPWSSPGRWQERLSELPREPAALPDALENFVIHHAIARSMGLGVPAAAEADRNLRSIERIVAALIERDDRPLTEHRAIANYFYGTCHDFALLAVGTLRHYGVPARLRVGCAGYFPNGKWEDHWVCEYRVGDRWALLDGQLGPLARDGFKIKFPVADMPAGTWRSAASVWQGIRAGTIDETVCGVSFAGIQGRWFVASAVLRDAAALAGIECLPWDYWGPGLRFLETRTVGDEDAALIDALAEALEPAPESREAAAAILERFPWARPTDTVTSVIVTSPVKDVAIQPA